MPVDQTPAICRICNQKMSDAIELKQCGHRFCSRCLHLNPGETSTCGVCNTSFVMDQFRKVDGNDNQPYCIDCQSFTETATTCHECSQRVCNSCQPGHMEQHEEELNEKEIVNEYLSDSDLSDDPGNYILPEMNMVLEKKDGDDSGEFESLGPENLMQLLSEIIDDVYQIINLPKTLIRLLLDHYKWDKDALIEQYFEVSQLRLFQGALIMPSLIQETKPFPCITLRSFGEIFQDEPHPSNSDIECEICYTPCEKCDLLAVGCRHLFCRSCWNEYLTHKIMDDNQGSRLCCPAYKCENLIDDDSIFSFISDPIVRRRFQKMIASSFVLSSRSMTWCPGLDCAFAVRSLAGNQARQIDCQNCGECFCFGCGNPWHEPVLCRYLRLWINKVNEDAGSSQWMLLNTKECPKCCVKIEKNGGCNHMTCRNESCKHEFCWLCFKDWKDHNTNQNRCNGYGDGAPEMAADEYSQSKLALERFVHYFDRYANHAQSRKFDSKLHESVQKRMEELQNQGMAWIDVKFVKHVVDVLCQCRRTLMYTYVFAYYLKKNNQLLMFENNQADLEQATEQLSEFFEWDLSSTALTDLKQKLQDKSRYCENRRRVLLDHVSEGYENDMWEHVIP